MTPDTSGLSLQVELTNLELVEKALRVIYTLHPEVVLGFLAEIKEEMEAPLVEEYLRKFLDELGLAQFVTNPAAKVIAQRLYSFIPDPHEAIQKVHDWLFWEDNEQGAIDILAEHIDGLDKKSRSLTSFVTGLLKVLAQHPIHQNVQTIIKKLSVRDEVAEKLHGNNFLVPLVRAYVPEQYTAEDIAETLWQKTQESVDPNELMGKIRSKFRKIEASADPDGLENLAVALIMAKESKWFFDFIGSVISWMDFHQGAFYNSTFGVIVRRELNGLAAEETLLDLEKAQRIADALREKFTTRAQGGPDALKSYLVGEYSLSTENRYQKALNWLIVKVIEKYGLNS